jgi:uncharacterized protein (DUF1330 family)
VYLSRTLFLDTCIATVKKDRVGVRVLLVSLGKFRNLAVKLSAMAAYVIVDVSIHDERAYEAYRKLTPAAVSAYDGKFVVRGGKSETLEGEWQPERIVVLEFPNVARAKEWWNSELYSEAKAIRQRSASTKMIVVEGA